MTAARLQQRAEQAVAGLPALILRAKRLASSMSNGSHGRRRPGMGDDFWQFRHSQPGDPLTSIDWRQSGKSDHLYVRETEWAIAHTTRIWVDPSPSMRWSFSAGREEKFERACLLAVAAAILLESAGERIAPLTHAGPAWHGRTAPARLAAALVNQPDSADWPGQLPAPRSTLLILSDFLQPIQVIAAHLTRWRAAGLRGHLLQVLDPAEEALPYQGRVLLQGLENEGDLLLSEAASLREDYRQQMMRHREALRAVARQHGWSLLLHHSDRPARQALIHLHAAMDRG